MNHHSLTDAYPIPPIHQMNITCPLCPFTPQTNQTRTYCCFISSPCPNTAWVERSALVYSNLFYLLPLAWLGYVMYKHKRYFQEGHPKQTIMTVLPEMITLLMLTISSSLYHSCADSWECTRVCVLSFDTLYTLDFTLSFQMFCMVILLHTRDTSMIWWKWCSFVVCLVINIVMVVYVQNTWSTVIVDIGVCLCLLVIRSYLQSSVVKEEIQQSNKFYFGIVLTCTVIALYCQLSARNVSGVGGNSEYFWKHSLWHLFTAVATLARMLMIPPMTTACTFPSSSSLDELSTFVRLT